MSPATTDARTDRIRWFGDLGLADAPQVGGKAANLGELRWAGLPVPPGFAIATSGYLEAMDTAGVRQALRSHGAEDPGRARSMVTEAGLPESLRYEVVQAYRDLGADVSVAVRSSAPAEDAADRSCAGIHESFVDIAGEDALVRAVSACWASLWTDRAVAYRAEDETGDEPSMAVVVQAMVEADRSGIAFTADPRTGATDVVVVEAVYGLGDAIVGGQVEPDLYLVAKDSLATVDVHVGTKDRQSVAGKPGTPLVPVDPSHRSRRVLDDQEVRAVCKLAVRIERLHGRPQDIEFAYRQGHLWVVQARPITTLTSPSPEGPRVGDVVASAPAEPTDPARDEVLVSGLAAGPGTATGRVRVLRSPTEVGQLLDGEVLVAEMTDPDWLPALRRACAVVTESGGVTCHAAIVGRELGRPVVVAAHGATTALHDGQLVTVDGTAGVVLEPSQLATPASRGSDLAVVASTPVAPGPVQAVTATAVYVNLAVPDQAERVAALPVDGVGLLRAEFLVADALDGRHPSKLVAEGRRDEYVARMAEGVSRIAAAFAPRPVVYRALDLRSNELRALEGGELEPDERNPMIGYRGCFRYVKDPDLFDLDLDVLATVRKRHRNVHLMIPFVRTRWELAACLDHLDGHRLGRDQGMLRWIMAEVPSVAYWLPLYAQLGIDGISIGSNDLTQLVLGVDRDSDVCSELFDTMDPAVLDTIERIIEQAQTAGLTTSLCGQAVSDHPELAEHLVRLGIDSVSVNPDVAVDTRRTIARAEQRILLDGARS